MKPTTPSGAPDSVTALVNASAATGRLRKIALEEHFSTPGALARGLVAKPTRNDAIFREIEGRLADFGEGRLAAMDAAGIDRAVLSLTTPGIQGEKDSATAIRLSQEANDFLAREVQKQPLRYGGFAALPTQDPAAAAAEAERAVRQLGFKGVLVNGQTHGRYLDDAVYLPFWERLQDLDVPLYLHPGALSDGPAMFAGQPALGGPVWAWTADTAAHALRLIFSGLFERFPRLKVVLGHMGEALPFLLWRIDDRHELDIGEPIAPERRPSFFFRRNFVVTTSGVCDTLPVLHGLAALGADNVLFSVDYPYQDSRQAGDFLDRLAVSDAMREAIASGNARRLLKLHEP